MPQCTGLCTCITDGSGNQRRIAITCFCAKLLLRAGKYRRDVVSCGMSEAIPRLTSHRSDVRLLVGTESLDKTLQVPVSDVLVSARRQIGPTSVGGLTKGCKLGRVLGLLALQQTEARTEHFAGVLVSP